MARKWTPSRRRDALAVYLVCLSIAWLSVTAYDEQQNNTCNGYYKPLKKCYNGLGFKPHTWNDSGIGLEFDFFHRPSQSTRSMEHLDVKQSIKGLRDNLNLSNNTFDPSLWTRVIIHGYYVNAKKSVWMQELKDAFLLKEPQNLIIVDWTNGAGTFLYSQAAVNTAVVGDSIAYLVRQLVRDYEAKPERFHLIGHSLGAYVAACAGDDLRGTLGRITGLDMAVLPKSLQGKLKKLDKSSARFVDVFHTSSLQKDENSGGFGLFEPSGHLDLYINGGFHQPQCAKRDCSFFNPLCKSSCDHSTAQPFFTKYIRGSCGILGIPCDRKTLVEQEKCIPNGGKRSVTQLLEGNALGTFTRGYINRFTNIYSSGETKSSDSNDMIDNDGNIKTCIQLNDNIVLMKNLIRSMKRLKKKNAEGKKLDGNVDEFESSSNSAISSSKEEEQKYAEMFREILMKSAFDTSHLPHGQYYVPMTDWTEMKCSLNDFTLAHDTTPPEPQTIQSHTQGSPLELAKEEESRRGKMKTSPLGRQFLDEFEEIGASTSDNKLLNTFDTSEELLHSNSEHLSKTSKATRASLMSKTQQNDGDEKKKKKVSSRSHDNIYQKVDTFKETADSAALPQYTYNDLPLLKISLYSTSKDAHKSSRKGRRFPHGRGGSSQFAILRRFYNKTTSAAVALAERPLSNPNTMSSFGEGGAGDEGNDKQFQISALIGGKKFKDDELNDEKKMEIVRDLPMMCLDYRQLMILTLTSEIRVVNPEVIFFAEERRRDVGGSEDEDDMNSFPIGLIALIAGSILLVLLVIVSVVFWIYRKLQRQSNHFTINVTEEVVVLGKVKEIPNCVTLSPSKKFHLHRKSPTMIRNSSQIPMLTDQDGEGSRIDELQNDSNEQRADGGPYRENNVSVSV